MKTRLLTLSYQYSFFLFGARGTGKSTLLHQDFSKDTTYWIDLLDPEKEAFFMREPNALVHIVAHLPKSITHIVIDEIQKVPKLLDVIHGLIETTSLCFVMTGSSARKLRHGAANLLAGRAFVYSLYPFTVLELNHTFDLTEALQFGLLPKVTAFNNPQDKMKFLQAYCHTYLKEEVVAEQLIKNLDPFRRFLEVAAQMNGKIINMHAISIDTGVDDKTIKNYYSILEDTLLGFFLEPFHYSFRKRLSLKPKFYFIDVGISRSLARQLTLLPQPGNSYYGELFEQFLVVEIYKLVQYRYPEAKLSYLKTKDELEIDLILEQPGQPLLLIEIKSTDHIFSSHIQTLKKISTELNATGLLLSRDPHSRVIEGVVVNPWDVWLREYFAIMVQPL